jgi:hypothetical protein
MTKVCARRATDQRHLTTTHPLRLGDGGQGGLGGAAVHSRLGHPHDQSSVVGRTDRRPAGAGPHPDGDSHVV